MPRVLSGRSRPRASRVGSGRSVRRPASPAGRWVKPSRPARSRRPGRAVRSIRCRPLLSPGAPSRGPRDELPVRSVPPTGPRRRDPDYGVRPPGPATPPGPRRRGVTPSAPTRGAAQAGAGHAPADRTFEDAHRLRMMPEDAHPRRVGIFEGGGHLRSPDRHHACPRPRPSDGPTARTDPAGWWPTSGAGAGRDRLRWAPIPVGPLGSPRRDQRALRGQQVRGRRRLRQVDLVGHVGGLRRDQAGVSAMSWCWIVASGCFLEKIASASDRAWSTSMVDRAGLVAIARSSR
jgi:hypothetical protein